MTSGIYIGIMTGTSLDGVDVSICNFKYKNEAFKLSELFFNTYPYPDELKDLIIKIITTKGTLSDISQLNFLLAKVYANFTEIAIRESNISKCNIKGIGMHGQTIWHQPESQFIAGMVMSSTLQAGSISALNQFTGLPVIGDFRAADIACGGQGAPLVPIFDYHFLKSTDLSSVALNIGGIANITYLPANCKMDEVFAFDTGPGNVLIDMTAKKYFGLDYDPDGNFARNGKILSDALDKLMKDDFVNAKFPKSTGRELYNSEFLKRFFNEADNPYDVLNTLTHFTAKSISLNINKLPCKINRIIISGGGFKNKYLVELIKKYSENIDIISSENFNIGIDSKEATCFAFLAFLHDLNISGNIPNATGAKKSIVLGVKAG